MTRGCVLASGLALAAALSTAAWAGGRGGGVQGGAVMMHPGGMRPGAHWGNVGGVQPGAHWGAGGRAVPPVMGTIHVLPNGSHYFSGWGHTNTALGGRILRGFGALQLPGSAIRPVPTLYGHTNTAPNGFRPLILTRRDRPMVTRFADGRRALRYGGLRRDNYGYAWRPRYDYAGGGYGPDISSAPAYDGGYAGYVETPLAARYAEPPMNQDYGDGSRGAYAPTPAYGSAPVYSGGPQVIVIHSGGSARGAAGCACARESRPSPIVYRFGIGSYY